MSKPTAKTTRKQKHHQSKNTNVNVNNTKKRNVNPTLTAAISKPETKKGL
ncbi:hypothetical protein [uncultured Methanobrevibacter sp.]|nr:hypothetical protein [uncultured Methanobrevibacter sp.]